mmetsp:Transcript_53373/g.85251  ORF Transcript_53373/g.85251 Transcript_53373/m.85251 type:complete len:226 (-) Transcript_53373:825-1502(-)
MRAAAVGDTRLVLPVDFIWIKLTLPRGEIRFNKLPLELFANKDDAPTPDELGYWNKRDCTLESDLLAISGALVMGVEPVLLDGISFLVACFLSPLTGEDFLDPLPSPNKAAAAGVDPMLPTIGDDLSVALPPDLLLKAAEFLSLESVNESKFGTMSPFLAVELDFVPKRLLVTAGFCCFQRLKCEVGTGPLCVYTPSINTIDALGTPNDSACFATHFLAFSGNLK